MTRPDLHTFTPGALFTDGVSDEVLECVGFGVVEELGEDVAVFRLVDRPTALVIATQRGYENGRRFAPVGDVIADELGDGDDAS